MISWLAHWQNMMVLDWKLNLIVCVHMDLMAAKLLSLDSETWNTGNSLPPWPCLCLILSLSCLCFYPISVYWCLLFSEKFFQSPQKQPGCILAFPPSCFMSYGLSLHLSLSLLFLSEVFIYLLHSRNTVDTRYYFHLEWRLKNLDSFQV